MIDLNAASRWLPQLRDQVQPVSALGDGKLPPSHTHAEAQEAIISLLGLVLMF